jgi:peptidoglycan-associated lipoprotein
MQRKGLALGLMIVMSIFVLACPKKAPQTTDDMSTRTTTVAPPPSAEQVTAPPVRPPVEDRTPDPLSGDLQEVNARALAQGLIGDIYFDYDQSELRSEARERLAKNAEFMVSHPQFTVTIEGHCDERGTNEYNLALGERRAAAARDYMTSLGVAASRLKTISYGEERPFCTDSSESCWSQNRRGHFVITGRSNVG